MDMHLIRLHRRFHRRAHVGPLPIPPGAVTDTIVPLDKGAHAGTNPTGGDHVFWDGNIDIETSTDNGSRNGGGDQQQASHWRDDALRSTAPLSERKIGIMTQTSHLESATRSHLRT
jgi:hypothetical protein